jgi:citrate lyase subunit beta / citryl-CoA lyase
VTRVTQYEPVWRSMLFVPAVNQRFVDGAAARGADAIILDLEDSIPPSQKQAAREALAGAIPIVAKGGADVLVRLNRPWRMLVRDLEAAVIPGVTALMVTKADSPEFVQDVAGIVAELEAERGLPADGIRFVILVETAAAFFRMDEIARAHPRIAAIDL